MFPTPAINLKTLTEGVAKLIQPPLSHVCIAVQKEGFEPYFEDLLFHNFWKRAGPFFPVIMACQYKIQPFDMEIKC